jgi:hypothetical protein
MVSEVDVVSTTRGVLLSVFGGAPQLAQPPPQFGNTPAVLTVMAVENVTVWGPVESELSVVGLPGAGLPEQSGCVMGMRVVLPVYVAVGVAMAENWANAGMLPGRAKATPAIRILWSSRTLHSSGVESD